MKSSQSGFTKPTAALVVVGLVASGYLFLNNFQVSLSHSRAGDFPVVDQVPKPGAPAPRRSRKSLPPSPVVFTRAYHGAKSGNENRKWSWAPGTGGGIPDGYLIKTSWGPGEGFYSTNTTYVVSDKEQHLAEGVYTITVQANNAAGLSKPTSDNLEVAYRNPAGNEMGVAGVTSYYPPGEEINNAVKVRYKFRVEENSKNHRFIKIVFGAHGLKGPGGAVASIEEDIMTDSPTYSDQICDHVGGLNAPQRQGETSLHVDISDYLGGAWNMGIKSFSPQAFPRHANVCIDNYPPCVAAFNKIMSGQPVNPADLREMTSRREMISQVPIDGRDISVEISRGDIITDKSGWQCGRALDSRTYRRWNVLVMIDGVRHDMAIAIPDQYGQYLRSDNFLNPRTEFFDWSGYYKVYYWDVQIQRESSSAWEPVNTWKVTEYDGYPIDYGIRESVYNGNNVIEISNDAPGEFFPKDTVFSLF